MSASIHKHLCNNKLRASWSVVWLATGSHGHVCLDWIRNQHLLGDYCFLPGQMLRGKRDERTQRERERVQGGRDWKEGYKERNDRRLYRRNQECEEVQESRERKEESWRDQEINEENFSFNRKTSAVWLIKIPRQWILKGVCWRFIVAALGIYFLSVSTYICMYVLH